LLVKSDDIDDFTVKLRTLLEDHALRRRFGENGRNAVMERYTWNKVAEKIYSFLSGSSGEIR